MKLRKGQSVEKNLVCVYSTSTVCSADYTTHWQHDADVALALNLHTSAGDLQRAPHQMNGDYLPAG